MYNNTIPSKSDLPSSSQLIRSTIVAILVATTILVTIVLPAEYAVDPIGVGRPLGFTEMGEIKRQLAQEAQADNRIDTAASDARAIAMIEAAASGVPVPSAESVVPKTVADAAPGRNDRMSVTLKPGEGAEVKLVMKQGEKARYVWTVAGGVVNVDLHGDGGGRSISYAKERGLANDEGTVTAAFDGNHGWFWRNRGDANVTVVLETRGRYANIKRLV